MDDERPAGGQNVEEHALVADLRAGDEAAFGQLVDRYYSTMLRVARGYVAIREAAEDVVQETFLGVIQSVDRFEGRSSLRTWIFHILVNRARSRGERESRTRPFSSLGDDDGPVVDPDRFLPTGRWAGFWSAPPSPNLPEAHALAAEVGAQLSAAIEGLPPVQRTVLYLRDVRNFTPREVCELLGISDGNQRVLLHRARSRARTTLERFLGAEVT